MTRETLTYTWLAGVLSVSLVLVVSIVAEMLR
jgi:hypothetical protein